MAQRVKPLQLEDNLLVATEILIIAITIITNTITHKMIAIILITASNISNFVAILQK